VRPRPTRGNQKSSPKRTAVAAITFNMFIIYNLYHNKHLFIASIT